MRTKCFLVALIALASLFVGANAYADEDVDLCGNIIGDQATVPDGYTRLNNVCTLTPVGGGTVPCVQNGTCPCFGITDANMPACRAQFYPPFCLELKPQQSPAVLPYPPEAKFCSSWERGYAPQPEVASIPMAVGGSALSAREDQEQKLISLLRQLLAVLQAEVLRAK